MRKVFVSSTTTGLQATRDAVCAAIDEMDSFTPVKMEAFGARPTAPLDTCLEMLRGSDVFVGIIGDAYGSSPPEGDPSFTEREYNEARRLGLPSLLFLTPGSADLVTLDPRQAGFRQRVLQENTSKLAQVMQPDWFATHVVTALSNLPIPTVAAAHPAPPIEQPVAGQFWAGAAQNLLGGLGVIVVSGIAGGLLTQQSGSLAQAFVGVGAVVAGLAALLLLVLYRYHRNVLAASRYPVGSEERRRYEGLRTTLIRRGNNIRGSYAERLDRYLNRLDGFFGDGTTADPGWLGRLVQLQKPAPLLTAPALERCLSIAFIYPLFVLQCIWLVTGHVGPAEAALGISDGVHGWIRIMTGLLSVALVPIYYQIWINIDHSYWKVIGWMSLLLVCMIVGSTIGIRVGSLVLFGSLIPTFTNKIGSIMALFGYNILILAASAHNFGSWSLVNDLQGGMYVATSTSICIFITLIFILLKDKWHYLFLWAFFPGALLLTLMSPVILGDLPKWSDVAPLVVFLPLFALVNAPFDWLALGLTRALLRRGIELGSWWPYVLAMLDTLLAAGIITMLALAMVLAVQSFDTVSYLYGVRQVLPLGILFDGLYREPSAPEYWWIYATLFSTMIPSIINLALGGLSVVRGIPWLARKLAQKLPIDHAVLAMDEGWMALVLTAQVAIGGLLGLAVQGLLVWGIIRLGFSAVGWTLFEMAYDVASLNLPWRLLSFVGSQ